MQPATVLIIKGGAAEATLVRAALARCTQARVIETLAEASGPVALAIADATTLTQSIDELKNLHTRGIPVVGVAAGLSQKARKRALAAGVREIHERPRNWRPYWELIESVVARFTERKD
jgi:hypothetical protein